MLNISIAYNVAKINKKTFRKSIAMYNIILYNNYSNKIQIKGDLQMYDATQDYRILERNEKEITELLEKKRKIDETLSQLYRQNFEILESLEYWKEKGEL